MYSTKVLEHLDNPRNVGAMADASARGEATNPVCGDLLHLYLKIADGKIIASSFQAQACPPCIAAASILTEMIQGLTVGEALSLKAADLTQALESLPRNKEHCSVLAIDALKAATKSL
ncbi:MAG TPA: iron-sulfur cluster assembly scaffold protein [Blastocatellia bacterium]|nr:iron-sulfur cluster assembly scaffold protein [Blastocatellia bacterium]